MAEARRSHACRALVIGLLILMTLLAARNLARIVPPGGWWNAAWTPDAADAQQLLFHFSLLPRLVVSLLCGAALALSGVIFQQVLRNPLASPSTLGVSAGASLALSVATACWPGLLTFGRESIAMLGAAVAMAAVFGVAWRQALSPLSVVLAGMVVSLYCGAVGAGLQLVLNPYSVSFYLWGAGSLSQDGWAIALYLLPRVAFCGMVTLLLLRPLVLLGLDDTSMRSLGVPLFGVRFLALAVAVALTAFVVSAVGPIGFVGLAAPVLVRLTGVRRIEHQLVWAPVLGAVLLCLTDQCVQTVFGGGREWIPTGTATTLVGAPLLLWMLPRVKAVESRPRIESGPRARRIGMSWHSILGMIGAVAVVSGVSLCFGKGPGGWHWGNYDEIAALAHWRAPRMVAGLSAGAMLAIAGALLQRLTGNAMAAPETLGIGAGAATGLIVVTAFIPQSSQSLRIAACLLGALATLATILLIGRRNAYGPQRILLAGFAASALLQVLVMVFMLAGGPRAFLLRGWLVGSTDLTTPQQAVAAACALVIFAPLVLLCHRWLAVLPLGDGATKALGVELAQSRVTILLLTALLTTAATLAVGPLGFVGLLGPHLARMVGWQRPMPHLLGAAALGALLMIVADWLGRTILFPYQLPAGLIATLIGGPYLIWLLARRSA